jgi:hypothetical protein
MIEAAAVPAAAAASDVLLGGWSEKKWLVTFACDFEAALCEVWHELFALCCFQSFN